MQRALDSLDRLVDTLEQRGPLSAAEGARPLFVAASIAEGLACALLEDRVRRVPPALVLPQRATAALAASA